MIDFPVQVWQEGTDDWRISIDGVEHQFKTEQEALAMIPPIGTPTIREQTAESVVLAAIDSLIPPLRDALGRVMLLQNQWEVNGMTDIVTKALAEGADIEGTPAKRLEALRKVFEALVVFLNTPVAGAGITPNQALNLISWRGYELPKE